MKQFALLAALVFAGSAAAGDMVFERSEYVSTMEIGKRPRAAAHTQIYSRIQPYQLFGDYTRQWHDRALYHNSALRYANDPQLESFRNEMKSLKEYDMAGLLLYSFCVCNRYKPLT